MKNKIFLIFIFIAAFLIRFYNYQYPPLLWDEAALGYNAYSILETGKDEYGQTLPLIFKSFNDYKPGLYVYLALPFVKLLGLNELSIRLPSILIGSLIPIFLFFLILKIDKKNYKLAYIAAILTVFNPFNITYSRLAWETNILTFEIILATYLYFTNKHLWSSLIIGLMLYTYQGGKLSALILIFILFSIYKSKIFTKQFIVPVFLLGLPILYGLLFNNNSNRLKVASLFSYPRSLQETQLIIKESGQLNYNLFHNQLIYFSRNFFQRYFNHFSPEFLTFVGDWQNARHGAPYVGVLLFPSIIFLFLGLFNYKKEQKFFLYWLLLIPLSSAFTRDSVSATRSMSLSIPLMYFTASGIQIFLEKNIKNYLPAGRQAVYCLLFTIYLISFIYWADLYFNHSVKTHPADWLFGYKEVNQYIIKNQKKYPQIYMTDFYGQPYIYYLFYSQYPPKNYQKQAKLIIKSVDSGNIGQIDNIKFAPVSWPLPQNSLSVFSYDEIVRQNLDFKNFKRFGNFYIYEKP